MPTALEKTDRDVAAVLRERLTSVTGREVLVRLSEAGLVERGCVILIGLDAIQERLGDRWERRKEQVWDAAMAHIARHLGPTDVSAQVSDTDIALAVLAGRDHAQVLGLKCLQELLVFFLGTYRPQDMQVHSVVDVSRDLVVCRPIAPPSAMLHQPPPAPKPPAPWETAPLADIMKRWSSLSFTCGGGSQTLDAALLLETLLSVRGRDPATPMGLRVHPTSTERATGRRANPYGRLNLTLPEQLAIDQATLEFAGTVMEIDSGAVIVPVSYEVASSSRGRAMLSAWISERAEAVAARVIFELVRVDAGTPKGRLTETIASLQARGPRIMVRAAASKAMLAMLRECRMNGVTLDCGNAPAEDLPSLLTTLGASAKSLAPVLCALSLPDMAATEFARQAGFTHASLSN